MKSEPIHDDLEFALKDLVDCLAQLTEQGELETTLIRELSIFRREQPSEPMTAMYESSSPEGFHLQALSEPYVSLSTHTAPIVLTKVVSRFSNVQANLAVY